MVLPEPFSPTRATTCPGPMSRSTPKARFLAARVGEGEVPDPHVADAGGGGAEPANWLGPGTTCTKLLKSWMNRALSYSWPSPAARPWSWVPRRIKAAAAAPAPARDTRPSDTKRMSRPRTPPETMAVSAPPATPWTAALAHEPAQRLDPPLVQGGEAGPKEAAQLVGPDLLGRVFVHQQELDVVALAVGGGLLDGEAVERPADAEAGQR